MGGKQSRTQRNGLQQRNQCVYIHDKGRALLMTGQGLARASKGNLELDKWPVFAEHEEVEGARQLSSMMDGREAPRKRA
ncbi:hypothetical protein PoB_006618500 [Plakobranchus ocellatus]|uniref:Uncharacterized protein n=1 Tax=Plakobranchus ocellatus TaxID=259542 RepID=A0AAV4D6H6_9GAST|nr:hypothetical protein PoB_006618500 [Plakobranchus ocellatus]